jgi:hypothetical protein
MKAIKCGLLTGLFFLIIGFALGAMVLTEIGQSIRPLLSILCAPGVWILHFFMTDMEMGHGGVMCLRFSNAFAYGLIGVVTGILLEFCTPRGEDSKT